MWMVVFKPFLNVYICDYTKVILLFTNFLFKDDIDHVKYNPYTLWVDKVSYKYMEPLICKTLTH
jgi:hypothetical protein